MSRPRIGNRGYKESIKKWRATMLERYGGVDGLHKKMQACGAKGGKSGRGPDYTGGFASSKIGEDGLTGYERARIAGAKGGHISRRGPAKRDDVH